MIQSTAKELLTWPTQPIPSKPAPLASLSFTREELNRVTEEAASECSELFASSRYEGLYTPPGKDQTIQFPGTLGGALSVRSLRQKTRNPLRGSGRIAFDGELIAADIKELCQCKPRVKRETEWDR